MAEIVEKPRSASVTAQKIAKRFFRREDAVVIIVLTALIGGMGVITRELTSAELIC